MRCLFNCLITVCKFFTDKLIYLLNILVLLPMTICIIAKSYNVHGLRNTGWENFILPIVIMLVIDIFYCIICRYIVCKRKDHEDGAWFSEV